mgnify:CR=1 FL=1
MAAGFLVFRGQREAANSSRLKATRFVLSTQARLGYPSKLFSCSWNPICVFFFFLALFFFFFLQDGSFFLFQFGSYTQETRSLCQIWARAAASSRQELWFCFEGSRFGKVENKIFKNPCFPTQELQDSIKISRFQEFEQQYPTKTWWQPTKIQETTKP